MYTAGGKCMMIFAESEPIFIGEITTLSNYVQCVVLSCTHPLLYTVAHPLASLDTVDTQSPSLLYSYIHSHPQTDARHSTPLPYKPPLMTKGCGSTG
jgi:hypothetical protein